MTAEELDKIFEELTTKLRRKTEMRLNKASWEMSAIQREETAYYDGAYDAIKKVKEHLSRERDA